MAGRQRTALTTGVARPRSYLLLVYFWAHLVDAASIRPATMRTTGAISRQTASNSGTNTVAHQSWSGRIGRSRRRADITSCERHSLWAPVRASSRALPTWAHAPGSASRSRKRKIDQDRSRVCGQSRARRWVCLPVVLPSSDRHLARSVGVRQPPQTLQAEAPMHDQFHRPFLVARDVSISRRCAQCQTMLAGDASTCSSCRSAELSRTGTDFTPSRSRPSRSTSGPWGLRLGRRPSHAG